MGSVQKGFTSKTIFLLRITLAWISIFGWTSNFSTHFWHVSDHVESDLGKVIVFALEDLSESSDGLLKGDQLTGMTGENLGNLVKEQ